MNIMLLITYESEALHTLSWISMSSTLEFFTTTCFFLSMYILYSNGEVWYKLRAAVQYILLRPKKAMDFLPGQNKVAADFMNRLDGLIAENGEVPDLNRWIARWGLECKS